VLSLNALHKALLRLEPETAHDLAEFKLDVAKNYASQAALKETEQRLTDHLVRIEHKLDRFARTRRGS